MRQNIPNAVQRVGDSCCLVWVLLQVSSQFGRWLCGFAILFRRHQAWLDLPVKGPGVEDRLMNLQLVCCQYGIFGCVLGVRVEAVQSKQAE